MILISPSAVPGLTSSANSTGTMTSALINSGGPAASSSSVAFTPPSTELSIGTTARAAWPECTASSVASIEAQALISTSLSGCQALTACPPKAQRRPGQAALPVERLGRAPACCPLDTSSGQFDHQAMATALHPGGEGRDGHVSTARNDRLGERSGPSGSLAEVGVEEQQVSRLAGAVPAASLPRRGQGPLCLDHPDRPCPRLPSRRLAAISGVANDSRACRGRLAARPVGRAVVDDHDYVHSRDSRRPPPAPPPPPRPPPPPHPPPPA